MEDKMKKGNTDYIDQILIKYAVLIPDIENADDYQGIQTTSPMHKNLRMAIDEIIKESKIKNS